MMIRYVGKSTVRELGKYRWAPENGYETEVDDPETLEEIMTYPKPDFEIVKNGRTESAPTEKEK